MGTAPPQPPPGRASRGGVGEELLGATLYGTAGHRPSRGCGPLAAAEATRHNVTKPHRPHTHLDAGRELRAGVSVA